MRWDVQVAAYFFVAAAFWAVCVTAAPDYLHLTGALSAYASGVGCSVARYLPWPDLWRRFVAKRMRRKGGIVVE